MSGWNFFICITILGSGVNLPAQEIPYISKVSHDEDGQISHATNKTDLVYDKDGALRLTRLHENQASGRATDWKRYHEREWLYDEQDRRISVWRNYFVKEPGSPLESELLRRSDTDDKGRDLGYFWQLKSYDANGELQNFHAREVFSTLNDQGCSIRRTENESSDISLDPSSWRTVSIKNIEVDEKCQILSSQTFVESVLQEEFSAKYDERGNQLESISTFQLHDTTYTNRTTRRYRYDEQDRVRYDFYRYELFSEDEFTEVESHTSYQSGVRRDSTQIFVKRGEAAPEHYLSSRTWTEDGLIAEFRQYRILADTVLWVNQDLRNYSEGKLRSESGFWCENDNCTYTETTYTFTDFDEIATRRTVVRKEEAGLPADESIYTEEREYRCDHLLQQIGYGDDFQILRRDEFFYPLEANCEKQAGIKVSVFPNPASQWVQIWHSFAQSSFGFEVVDIQGQVLAEVSECAGSSYLLDISGLPTGVYALRVRAGEELAIKSLVISH